MVEENERGDRGDRGDVERCDVERGDVERGDVERGDVTSRRGLLLGGAAAAAASLGGAALADTEAEPQSEAHHGHHDHAGPAVDAGPHHPQVVAAALNCVAKAEACLAHCIALMGAGDTSLKGCAEQVSATLPVMQTLARLAALDAKRLKLFALVAIDFCKDCAAECKKHAPHHAACKACMEACLETAEVTEKLIAS